METDIQTISIYNEGLIQISVNCLFCKKTNYHIINHTSNKKDDKLIIDFSKLGKRSCDSCNTEYKLYK